MFAMIFGGWWSASIISHPPKNYGSHHVFDYVWNLAGKPIRSHLPERLPRGQCFPEFIGWGVGSPLIPNLPNQQWKSKVTSLILGWDKAGDVHLASIRAARRLMWRNGRRGRQWQTVPVNSSTKDSPNATKNLAKTQQGPSRATCNNLLTTRHHPRSHRTTFPTTL